MVSLSSPTTKDKKEKKEMTKLTDESPMPWGKYKGDKMINVPASYLIWLYDNDKCSGDVKEYIKENYDVLNHEINKTK